MCVCEVYNWMFTSEVHMMAVYNEAYNEVYIEVYKIKFIKNVSYTTKLWPKAT